MQSDKEELKNENEKKKICYYSHNITPQVF
jgi:hypothetical protein